MASHWDNLLTHKVRQKLDTDMNNRRRKLREIERGYGGKSHAHVPRKNSRKNRERQALDEQSDGPSFWGNIEEASREVQNWPHWKKQPYESNLPQKK